MRRGGGKAKGSAFERKVCEQLSLWISKGEKRDLFWRSAMSGGRTTVARKKGVELNRQAGDICAVSPEGHCLTTEYYIECKFYRDLDLDAFMFGKGQLAKFWKTTQREALKNGRKPILIAKQNGKPVLWLMQTRDDQSLDTFDPEPIAFIFDIDCAVFYFESVLSENFSNWGLQ